MDSKEFEDKYTSVTELFKDSTYTVTELKKGYFEIKNSSGKIIGYIYNQASFKKNYLFQYIPGLETAAKSKSKKDELYNIFKVRKFLLPDFALFNLENKHLYVGECKFQVVEGTAHEKTWGTPEYYRWHYGRMLEPVSNSDFKCSKVEPYFVFNKEFTTLNPDTYEFLKNQGETCFVDELPELSFFNL